MCGLTGFITSGSANNERLQVVVHTMTDTITHRGPDDSGIWVDDQAGIALGHRRLAVQDISPQGHQPMLSVSGRFVIVFNGEIYNFRAIRRQIDTEASICWRGHSDTEILLAAIEHWGLRKTLKESVGMFAFALWDRQERNLTIVRDRLGEKPLYYGWQGHTFLFGSELKALRFHPDWRGEIDCDALALYLRHSYIPSPYSIYKGIYKLMPGTYLNIPINIKKGDIPDAESYWPIKKIVEDNMRRPLDCSDLDAVDRLDQLLRETIRDKMISDVPLGAFLSGGIDSSLVVAMMQAESHQPVKTFSIGFYDEYYNEAKYARAVANHLGTEHSELYVTDEQAMNVIPRLAYLYDEPFADSSQIPTLLVAEMAKKYVTVALSGDGGDELFCGYTRYFLALMLWGKLERIPDIVCSQAASMIKAVPLEVLNSLLGWLSPAVARFGRMGTIGDKLHKGAELLRVGNPVALHQYLTSHWKQPEKIVLGSAEPLTAFTDPQKQANLHELMLEMMFLDLISYLPDDILVKVDRAAMGVSLETRIPMLDHRVVEFAWRLPLSMKARNGQGKWILKQVLDKYIPHKLIDRPKMGFGVPLDVWLRGPLFEWAANLLDEKKLNEDGFFDSQAICRKWSEHLSEKRNWAYYLWDVLMFQAWFEAQ